MEQHEFLLGNYERVRANAVKEEKKVKRNIKRKRRRGEKKKEMSREEVTERMKKKLYMILVFFCHIYSFSPFLFLVLFMFFLCSFSFLYVSPTFSP